MFTATQEQIKDWKKKYGNVFQICAGKGDEQKCCYLHTPSRQTISYASTAQSDPMKFNAILLKECWIEGDPEMRDDDSYFLGVSSQLGNIIEVKTSSLVKL